MAEFNFILRVSDVNHPDWIKHKKHIFIFTDAGKPIYCRFDTFLNLKKVSSEYGLGDHTPSNIFVSTVRKNTKWLISQSTLFYKNNGQYALCKNISWCNCSYHLNCVLHKLLDSEVNSDWDLQTLPVPLALRGTPPGFRCPFL